jgi:zinc protease
VRTNVTLESLELFREQLRNYADTYTAEDLETTKNLLVKQATQNFETLNDLLGVLHEISALDLPLDYVEREQQEIMELELDEVRAMIRDQIDESRMIYVVVGDAATQLGRIEQLGYGNAVRLDIHGEPSG